MTEHQGQFQFNYSNCNTTGIVGLNPALSRNVISADVKLIPTDFKKESIKNQHGEVTRYNRS